MAERTGSHLQEGAREPRKRGSPQPGVPPAIEGGAQYREGAERDMIYGHLAHLLGFTTLKLICLKKKSN